MKITVLFIGICFILSCGTLNRNRSLNTENNFDINEQFQSNQAIQDSIIVLNCRDQSQSIKVKNLTWVYINDNIYKCIISDGFHGNIEANQQIANIIRLKGISGFSNLLTGQPKFRGPEVFEAFLDISADDFSPSVDFDGNKSEIQSKSESFAHYYLEMLLTIEGLSFNEYGNKIYKNHTFVHPEFIEGKAINYDHYLEFWKLVLNGIKQAWKNNLIVLKPYGQE
jgi:hypothetical protein